MFRNHPPISVASVVLALVFLLGFQTYPVRGQEAPAERRVWPVGAQRPRAGLGRGHQGLDFGAVGKVAGQHVNALAQLAGEGVHTPAPGPGKATRAARGVASPAKTADVPGRAGSGTSLEGAGASTAGPAAGRGAGARPTSTAKASAPRR